MKQRLYKLAPWEVIQKLTTDNSRIFKQKVLAEQANTSNDTLFLGLALGLDSSVTFGIKAVPEKKDDAGVGLSWEKFVETAEKFQNRTSTGNQAKSDLAILMSLATENEWNFWYRRILIKDFKCGVSTKTVNTVVSEINEKYVIKTFSPQLAHDGKKREKDLRGEKMIDMKLDGVRCLTFVWPDGQVKQYSREGIELVNFEKIKTLFSSVAQYVTEPVVFDGEITSETFQDLMTQVHRKENVQADDAFLYLFDMVTQKEFDMGSPSGGSAVSQKERRDRLVDWYHQQGVLGTEFATSVDVLSYELVNLSTAGGKARLEELKKYALVNCFEGIMVKDPTAGYVNDRTTAWLKLKPEITVDLRVISVKEGTGKHKGKMGAVLGHGVEDGKVIEVSVGGGWSDKQREDIFKDPDAITNQVMEVVTDGLTKSRSSNTYSLRFPRFKRFRMDKTV